MEVKLYVYDLSRGMAKAMSGAILGKQIDGIWHTGIVVFGYEYYYGGGIQCALPGHTMAGQPTQVIELGTTHIPQDVFHEFLHNVSPRFTPETYSLLSHNCNNFTSEASQFLLGTDIPPWITGLPEEALSTPMGQMLRPMITQFENQMKQQVSGSFVPWSEHGSDNGAPLNLPPASTPASNHDKGNLASSAIISAKNEPMMSSDSKLRSYVMLIKVLSKKLDAELQVTPDEYSVLQSYSGDDFDPNVVAVVERLLRTWKLGTLFPVLGLFRHLTTFEAMRDLYVQQHIDHPCISRLLEVITSSDSKMQDVAMTAAIFTNLCSCGALVIELTHNEQFVDIVMNLLQSTQPLIKSAACQVVYNASLHVHKRATGDVSLRLVSGIVEFLNVEHQKLSVVYTALLALGHLLVNDNESVELVQVLGFDAVERVTAVLDTTNDDKSDERRRITQLAHEVKALVI